MMPDSHRPLRIGITCYPSVGGSGILATSLGEELAARGHEVHFISYERPFRLPVDGPRLHFHPVEVNSYDLFKYPDYTLPLSVKLSEVTRAQKLDILHAHYAVPHASAALLARDMLPESLRPKVVTTLHGTDTTLLGRDSGYGPAIRHALDAADGITAVSCFLRDETLRLIATRRPIEVIHNFFTPRVPSRTRAEVRAELRLRDDEVLLFHASNLRPIKRFDALLDAFARLQTHTPCKLLVLAGGNISTFAPQIARLKIAPDSLLVRENIPAIEDYVQAADLGLFTSSSESFCLSILECMAFGIPSVSTCVGGIPEVCESGRSGLLVPLGDESTLVDALASLIRDPARRTLLGAAARHRAGLLFCAPVIVEHYIRYYRSLITAGSFCDGAGI